MLQDTSRVAEKTALSSKTVTDPNGTKIRRVSDVKAASCRLESPEESGMMSPLRWLNLVPFVADPFDRIRVRQAKQKESRKMEALQ